ncbi:nucleotide exchange factor GrpE [Candidatus Laterigemmans baculatus]|uniref:nucleotide exchange factor GrpE n=1 Tax=Candidatus Laterigemmans baculatus TaxID=2770505 RepID=UPI0013DA96B0|nr:nucleotide exchange factor GrpE [Candidatus Laterigemmans baculatus]
MASDESNRSDEAFSPEPSPAAEPSWEQTRQQWIERFSGWVDTLGETEAGREQLRSLEPAELSSDAAAGEARRESGAPLAGLLEVVASLTALRHELKLQTKSSRVLIERVGADADRLVATADRIVQQLDAERLAASLIESLIDVDEAVGRFHEAIEALAVSWPAAPPPPPRSSWWSRRSLAAARDSLAETWEARHRRLAGLAQGVRLLASRLENHLSEHQIERIGQVGEPVDPHCMQVLEVVTDQPVAAGTVAQVLRPGYRRGERVLRSAQVAAQAAGE